MSKILDSSKLEKKWHAQWREILGMSTADMPDDICEDGDLCIGIWDAELEKQKECFSIFENGSKMLERANEIRLMTVEASAVDDKILLGYLDDMNYKVSAVLAKTQNQRVIELNNEKQISEKQTVYRGENKLRDDLFYHAINPTDPLDQIIRDLFEEHFGLEGYATYEFLSEPFYQTTHDMVIKQAIMWASLQDIYKLDPYQSVVDLHKVNAQGGWNSDDKEMFVFMSLD